MCLMPQAYREASIEQLQQCKVFHASPAMLTPPTKRPLPLASQRPGEGVVEIIRIPERHPVPLPLAYKRKQHAFSVAVAIDLCVLALRDGGALALANRLKRTPPLHILRVLRGVIARCAEENDIAGRLRRQCDRAGVSLDDWLEYCYAQREEAKFAYN